MKNFLSRLAIGFRQPVILAVLGCAGIASSVQAGLSVADLGKLDAGLSARHDHEGTEAKWAEVRDLLGEAAHRVVVKQTGADLGGNTSVRSESPLNWKDKGYFRRARDLGQVFTAPRHFTLDAIVLRTGNDHLAFLPGAADAEVFVQFFEVLGTPVIDDNGTPPGTDAKHGFSTNHRCDDFVKGVEYRPLHVATGGRLPDLAAGGDGRLTYMKWDLTDRDELQFAEGKRYAFMVGFAEAGADHNFTLANRNNAASPRPPEMFGPDDTYVGGWGLRREGNGRTPPLMLPGEHPPEDPELLRRLRTEAAFPSGDGRFAIPPTCEGYPDVDAYRDLEFYLVAAKDVVLDLPEGTGPAVYGAKQLEQTLLAKGYRVVPADDTARFAITVKTTGHGPAEGFRITKLRENHRTRIQVTGNDERGSLYGTLALAEALTRTESLAEIPESSASARFPFRAIKFNLPWYSYRAGEALSLHDETCRDPAFWEAFLDMMARNRFNTLTLWSLHPFPLMIRNSRFPEACPLSDTELAEWQAFWRRLFAMARERGIDTYIVNWNIFVSPSFAAEHNVATYCDENMSDQYFGEGETAEIVKEYTRTTVTQLLDTYPNLTGLGISLGERMGGMTAQERENWILETVVAGMQNAGRKARLIHRAPFSAGTGSGGSTSLSTEALTRQAIESLNLPEPIWVEVKFNWSHAQSSPHLVHVHGGKLGDTYWNPMPRNYRICWMARNEDFFCLRWSQPDFVRKHIALNGQDYVGGYFLGSECYIPAKDYMTRPNLERPWSYAFERQWLYYMTWGRLLYDPDTPNEVFINACEERYGPPGRDLFQALQLASRMPLRLASFYKGTWDFTLYSEGFSSINATSNPDHFIGLPDLIDHPVLDPNYLSIPDFVKARRSGTPLPDSTITPLRLAEQLENDGNRAREILRPLHENGDPDLAYEVADAEAWAWLSLYFAEKLRGAVAYHEAQTGDKSGQATVAVEHLTRALAHWDKLIEVTEPIYAVMPLAQVHHDNRPFHWKLLRPQVVRDLELARQEE